MVQVAIIIIGNKLPIGGNKNIMNVEELIYQYSDTLEHKEQAIFSTLYIVGNRLQTLFDNHIKDISLKQFMLLSIIRNSKKELTFTQLGEPD